MPVRTRGPPFRVGNKPHTVQILIKLSSAFEMGSENYMKLKLTIAFIALAIITAFVSRTENEVTAETTRLNDVATDPTPAAKPKANRDFVFLDSWDGVKLRKTDATWKSELNELEFYVLRKQGTEKAY